MNNDNDELRRLLREQGVTINRLTTLVESLVATRLSGSAPRDKKRGEHRNISDIRYYTYACAMLRILLQPENQALGKLTVSLYREMKVTESSFRLLLQRLETETGFLFVSQRVHGQASYVRIKPGCMEVAQRWLEAHEKS